MAKKPVKEKHAGGRPTLYKEEFCDVTAYLQKCTKGNKLPTKTGYALYLKVSKRVTEEWEKKYPKFMCALREISDNQREKLINQGLKGKYNSTIAKLMLSSNHGMSEKQQIEHSGQILQAPVIE